MHFLLQIENENYTEEMREYISNNLSDDIISNELSQIIIKFVDLLKNEPKKMNFQANKQKTEKVINIEYMNNDLNGIISYLKNEYGENLIEKGELIISDNGNHHNCLGSLSNLIKYDDNHINDYYRNNSGSNPLPTSSEGWIEFDFKKRKINLTSYTIRNRDSYGYDPKSWRILGSNDRKEWEIINQQSNISTFKSKCMKCRFECDNKNQYYQYIRYIQDDSWTLNRKYNVDLTCIEFFGSISAA